LPHITLMENDKLYRMMVAKMQEIAFVPPQQMGLFTPLYKRIVPVFKEYPLKSLVFLSLAATFIAFIVFGSYLIRLASILQLGAFYP